MSQVKWTLKGHLKLKTQCREIAIKLGDLEWVLPLEGVRISVSAKESKNDPTGFQEWGEDVTDANGFFVITKEKDESARYFQVRAMFKDARLKLYPGGNEIITQAFNTIGLPFPHGAAVVVAEEGVEYALQQMSRLTFDVDWITIVEAGENKREGPLIDFGPLIFRQDAGAERGDAVPRRHADFWVLTKLVMSYLDSLGAGFVESKPTGIKYPHNNLWLPDGPETAYADPFNDTIFLIQNARDDQGDEYGTLMHELMHLRNYQHCTGETAMAWQVLAHRTTHDGYLSETFTAFHEAFAEVGKCQLWRHLFGEDCKIYGDANPSYPGYQQRPFNRNYLRRKNITTLDALEHSEFGWISVFNLLLCGDAIIGLDMDWEGTESNPQAEYARPQPEENRPLVKHVHFNFQDLLRAFDPLPHHPRVIDKSEMNLKGFFRRLADVKPEFDSEMQSAYLQILNPAGTKQPAELLPPLKAKVTGVQMGKTFGDIRR